MKSVVCRTLLCCVPSSFSPFQPVRGVMASTTNCFLLYFQWTKHATLWSKLDLTPCPPRNSNKEMQWKWPVIQSRNDIIQGPIFFNPVSCCYFWLNLTISPTWNIYPDPTWLELQFSMLMYVTCDFLFFIRSALNFKTILHDNPVITSHHSQLSCKRKPSGIDKSVHQ